LEDSSGGSSALARDSWPRPNLTLMRFQPRRHLLERLGVVHDGCQFGRDILGGQHQLAHVEHLAVGKEAGMLGVVVRHLRRRRLGDVGDMLLQVGLRQDQGLGAFDRLHHFRVAVELFLDRFAGQQLALDQALQQLLAGSGLLGCCGTLDRCNSSFSCSTVTSSRVLARQHHLHRLEHDPQVQPQRPVAQIIQVVLDARFHLVQRGGFTTQAVDLGPAGNARLDLVAQHVALDHLAVLLVVRDRVRARADDAHPSLQHVDELRQLVQRGAAQEAADAGQAPSFFCACTTAVLPFSITLIERNL
jgi:hypothetical protein